ncbi:D-tyrosyl-tRNA(Tyr) deacylase [Candidatus Rhodobacter oscarellae]|uniref:D-aminoacyl-tRNA deacylase n=1 Tax=Candidatus Rhodobacter oscarellae TaxID=1675527 RepID=A0A0J9E9X8_9RHOB|nr:D-tyrosyl-tRNA(Tyr) deacylase [Candidatus Rhodobacter lobularis]
MGEIGPGLLILVCAMQGDTEAEADKLSAKIAKLRIFQDEAGKMNRSLLDTGGGALVVSQFTLAADTSRGNRPGFSTAAPPAEGETLYEYFADQIRAQGIATAQGKFGADMKVALTNDGPVTIWMDTDAPSARP